VPKRPDGGGTSGHVARFWHHVSVYFPHRAHNYTTRVGRNPTEVGAFHDVFQESRGCSATILPPGMAILAHCEDLSGSSARHVVALGEDDAVVGSVCIPGVLR
jgi:hypothetical protein